METSAVASLPNLPVHQAQPHPAQATVPATPSLPEGVHGALAIFDNLDRSVDAIYAARFDRYSNPVTRLLTRTRLGVALCLGASAAFAGAAYLIGLGAPALFFAATAASIISGVSAAGVSDNARRVRASCEHRGESIASDEAMAITRPLYQTAPETRALIREYVERWSTQKVTSSVLTPFAHNDLIDAVGERRDPAGVAVALLGRALHGRIDYQELIPALRKAIDACPEDQRQQLAGVLRSHLFANELCVLRDVGPTWSLELYQMLHGFMWPARRE